MRDTVSRSIARRATAEGLPWAAALVLGDEECTVCHKNGRRQPIL